KRMCRYGIALVIVLLSYPCAQAQWDPNKTPAEVREEAAQAEVHRQEVAVLEREAAHSWQMGNTAYFQRVYGDDFVGTNEVGLVLSKPLLIRQVLAGDVKFTSVVATDIHVRFFEKTAVVQALWSMRGTRNGQAFSRQLRVIHIYVDGPRGWAVVAGQQTA